jgi:hypothetical protein
MIIITMANGIKKYRTVMSVFYDFALSASTLRKRKALTTTTRELADIPSAAIQGAIKPAAARGKADML